MCADMGGLCGEEPEDIAPCFAKVYNVTRLLKMVIELKGGTTMKMKKLVGALALTAALAMGTAPAFATGTVDTDGTDNEFSDNGSTTIKARVDAVDVNVRATVPLQVTVVFGNEGYSDIIGPSSDAYYVENIGEGDIQVSNVEITDMNSFFTSSSFQQNATPSGKNLMFFYETNGNCTYLTTAHPASQGKTTTADRNILTSYGKTAKAWNAGADAMGPGDKLNISLTGAAYFDEQIAAEDFSDTLCKVKYTIEAA